MHNRRVVIGREGLSRTIVPSARSSKTLKPKFHPGAAVGAVVDAIDPRYAKRSNLVRTNQERTVATITKLPEPRRPVLYVVGDVARTLADWSRPTGIPKATLHHRVVTRGMEMADAIAVGEGVRGRPLEFSGVRFCRNTPAKLGQESAAPGSSEASAASDLVRDQRERPPIVVPRDGIEPPTRGFSIPLSRRDKVPFPREKLVHLLRLRFAV